MEVQQPNKQGRDDNPQSPQGDEFHQAVTLPTLKGARRRNNAGKPPQGWLLGIVRK
jgi:hypothetical protein